MAIDPAWLTTEFPDLSNVQPLDDGGQKSVLTAEHPTDGRNVLKLFHPGADVERASGNSRLLQLFDLLGYREFSRTESQVPRPGT